VPKTATGTVALPSNDPAVRPKAVWGGRTGQRAFELRKVVPMKLSKNPHLALAKLRIVQRDGNLFWRKSAERLVHVGNFRGFRVRNIFYDPGSGRELSFDEVHEIQRELNNTMRQLDFETARQFPIGEFLGKRMMSKAVREDDDPETYFAGIPAEQVADFRTVIQSQKDAMSALVIGKTPPDIKTYVLRLVERQKTFNNFAFKTEIVRVIHEAAQQNDLRFFKRLADALESKKPRPAIDWCKPTSLDQFLASCWCDYGQSPTMIDNKFPPLCLFEGKARAEFCAQLFRVNNDSRFIATIRQAVKRLGLKRAQQPKIKAVHVTDNTIRFD
jgi:hypothetical protein